MVVIPTHMHGIIEIVSYPQDNRNPRLACNYYEHIISDKKSFQNISNYIYWNPQKWDKDRFILTELIRKTYLTSQI